jgi:hypothetical protein
MKKTILSAIGTALIAISASQPAVAAPHHYAHRIGVSAQQKFRDANNSIAQSAAAQRDWANYGEAGITSAPAGR